MSGPHAARIRALARRALPATRLEPGWEDALGSWLEEASREEGGAFTGSRSPAEAALGPLLAAAEVMLACELPRALSVLPAAVDER